ncbi:LysR family transcriptional regulator [Duganella sp. FT80W]|uniref:LysR family transcriptional regulator n=1 Tax=Duganella guangzhouensis TaxID=2666084 RepID=A0A6I2L6V3_9BURK|nr:LysR family transcriptional regulator [Duganella guangzhouensis]MRW93490.1 LysR family transcriptional regulator [Duganella guangzhouensis]
MNLEFNQLRCFVTVAEELHFGRAAARLHMTQPPLTRHIQLLEHALGVALFERTSRSVRLTTAGRVFLTDARRLLQFAEQAAQSARQFGTGAAGKITIGFTAVSGYELIPSLIASASEQLPGITLLLKEMVSVGQFAALEAGTIDLGFVRPLNTASELSFQLIAREPLLLAMPERHPLLAHSQVALTELHRQRFIMYSPDEGKYFHDLIHALLHAPRVVPNYVQHISQTHSIIGLVRAGMGIAIVPASAQHFNVQGVAFRELADATAYAELYMAWRPDHRNPALDALLGFASSHFSSVQQPHPAA